MAKQQGSNAQILKKQIRALQLQIKAKDEEILGLLKTNDLLDQDRKHIEQEFLNYANDVERFYHEKIEEQNLYQQIINEDLVKALINIDSLKASQCLALMQQLLKARIIISPHAYKCAKEIDDTFKNSRQLVSMLSVLAIDYLDSLRNSEEPKCFTKDQFSSHESETTKNNSTLATQRIFPWNGKMIEMSKHLKIGVANNEASTIRIYFEYLADEDKILVGYCGKHLGLLTR